MLKSFTAAVNVSALPSVAVVTPFKMPGAACGASYGIGFINGELNVTPVDARAAWVDFT